MVSKNKIIKHQVHRSFDHSIKRHNLKAHHVLCKFHFPVGSSGLFALLSSTCIKAQTVQSAVITFNNWTSEEIHLYDDAQVVEIEWIVGPIPIDDNIGKEIIMRYDTDIQSQSKYYTDANGQEVLERTRDYRPTWSLPSMNQSVEIVIKSIVEFGLRIKIDN